MNSSLAITNESVDKVWHDHKIPPATAIIHDPVEKLKYKSRVVWPVSEETAYLKFTPTGQESTCFIRYYGCTPADNSKEAYVEFGKRGVEGNIEWQRWTTGYYWIYFGPDPSDAFYVRGTNVGSISWDVPYYKYVPWFDVSGILGALYDWETVVYDDDWETTICEKPVCEMAYLFQNFPIGDASGLILPSKLVKEGQFKGMFKHSLVTNPPALDALVMTPHCYEEMFTECHALNHFPELPAKVLAEYCYASMFEDTLVDVSTGMKEIINLPATTLPAYCYHRMFYDVAYTTMGSFGMSYHFPNVDYIKEHACEEMFGKMRNISEIYFKIPKYVSDYGCTGMFKSGSMEKVYLDVTANLGRGTKAFAEMFQLCYSIGYFQCGWTDELSEACFTNWLNKAGIWAYWPKYDPIGRRFPTSLLTSRTTDGNNMPPLRWLFPDNMTAHITLKTDVGTEADKTFTPRFISYRASYDSGANSYLEFGHLEDDGQIWWQAMASGGQNDYDGTVTTTRELYIRGVNVGNMSLLRIEEDDPAFGNVSGQYAAVLDYTLLNQVNYPDLLAARYRNNPGQNAFAGMKNLTDASNLVIADLKCTDGAFSGMFSNCENLAHIPMLPPVTTSLGSSCFASMFKGTAISVAPELPWTELAGSCYESMFAFCPNLTTPPELPAVDLKEYCYNMMFHDSGITSLPTIPSNVNVGIGSFGHTFSECKNLPAIIYWPYPAKVDRLGMGSTFAWCENITEFHFTGTPTPMSDLSSEASLFGFLGAIPTLKLVECEWTDLTENRFGGWLQYVSPTGEYISSAAFTPEQLAERTVEGNHMPPLGWIVNS